MVKNGSTPSTENPDNQNLLEDQLTKLKNHLSLYSKLNNIPLNEPNLTNIITDILNILNGELKSQTEPQTKPQTNLQIEYDEWKRIVINIINDIYNNLNYNNLNISNLISSLENLLINKENLVNNLQRLYSYIDMLKTSNDLITTILSNIKALIKNITGSEYVISNNQTIAQPDHDIQAFENINSIITEINNNIYILILNHNLIL